MSESVIEVAQLTRRFGDKTALDSVSISIPRGGVYGLVGANGAGKTTLIRHVLGLLRAEQGSIRVFGLDPVAEPVGVLSRIGYLSKALSKGQKARVGLLLALAHRPELLVLDEPSSGLDPIVRRDILGAILRTIAHEGRTVLFSSHLLDEVEEVADHVTMISEGKVALSAPLNDIRKAHRCLTVRFALSRPQPPAVGGVLRWDGRGEEWTAVCRGESDELRAAVAAWEAEVVAERVASLDEIFVAHVGVAAAPAP